MSDDEHEDEHMEQEPEVFAVDVDTDRVRFSRRHFVEIAAASAATAMVVAGCDTGKPSAPPSSPKPHQHSTPSSTPSPSPTPTPATTSPSPTPTPPPGTPGTVRPGTSGAQYKTGGKSYVLPCDQPVPAGAVCTCNCVTVPPSCSCVGYTACSCVGYTACSCVSYTSGSTHYWYPN